MEKMKNAVMVDLVVFGERSIAPRVLRIRTDEPRLLKLIEDSELFGSLNELSGGISGHTIPGMTSVLMKDHLFLWDKYGFRKVAVRDITHLKASRSYCEVFLRNNERITLSLPMAQISKFLPAGDFIRIHRSYMVNLVHVNKLIGNTIVTGSGEQLTVGREFQKEVFRRFVFVGSRSRKYTEG